MATPCPNCGAPHEANFCNECGQSNVDLHLPLRDLLSEAFEEAFGFDSRIRHTLLPFFFRPGEITRDYLSGRRVRFTSPLKLYLIASLIFFFTASLQPISNAHLDKSAASGFTSGIAQGADLNRPGAKPPVPHNRFGLYVQKHMERMQALGDAEVSRRLSASMLELLPKAMFAFLPIFAWLLRCFWPRRFYAEHLIFALHFHAFALILWTPDNFFSGGWIDYTLNVIILCLLVLYLFFALRRVYGDGILRTIAKLTGLGLSYAVLLSLGISTIAIGSLLSL